MTKILNYLLRLLKIELIAIPRLPYGLLASAKEMISQTENMIGSGEYKRAQALRALLNRHPEARERECALAIELGLL